MPKNLTTADMIIAQFLGDEFYSPEERKQLKAAKEFTGMSVLKDAKLLASGINSLDANAYELKYKGAIGIRTTEACSCYFCGKSFPKSEITEWVDDNKTALCPYCGKDSITNVMPYEELLNYSLKMFGNASAMLD